ncbi:MAG: cytochrome c-type protein [Elusimicrobia bacterium]|nr:MAG: cytochrome c-type protein [Elusimicrobiota bacterium]KAF0158166.1 MAG: cytochrome c-type protein [Elusimicrobiota bacterium]
MDAPEKIKRLLLRAAERLPRSRDGWLALLKKNQELVLRLSALAVFAGGGALFMLFGPPRLVTLTETPAFCGACHSMKGQHKDWRLSSHRQNWCIDCHLPNDNAANHYLWKALDGGKDVFFEFSGLREHDEISLTGHGKRVLQKNCIRCHGGVMARMDTTRACIDCHRGLAHRRGGLPGERYAEDK